MKERVAKKPLLLQILNLLIWWLDLRYEGDIKKEDVKSEFEMLFKGKTKTWMEELILWSGSIVMFIIILIRTTVW